MGNIKGGNLMNRMMVLKEDMYDELCKTLTDFENATDDYLTDSEWVKIFYNLCVKMQREIM